VGQSGIPARRELSGHQGTDGTASSLRPVYSLSALSSHQVSPEHCAGGAAEGIPVAERRDSVAQAVFLRAEYSTATRRLTGRPTLCPSRCPGISGPTGRPGRGTLPADSGATRSSPAHYSSSRQLSVTYLGRSAFCTFSYRSTGPRTTPLPPNRLFVLGQTLPFRSTRPIQEISQDVVPHRQTASQDPRTSRSSAPRLPHLSPTV
jgi:hypothetical protein